MSINQQVSGMVAEQSFEVPSTGQSAVDREANHVGTDQSAVKFMSVLSRGVGAMVDFMWDGFWLTLSWVRSFARMVPVAFNGWRGADPVLRYTVLLGVVLLSLYSLTVVTSDVMGTWEIVMVLAVEALVVVCAIVAVSVFPLLAARVEGRWSWGK